MALTKAGEVRRAFEYVGFTDGGPPVAADGNFKPGDWCQMPDGIAICVKGGNPGTWTTPSAGGGIAGTITAVTDTIPATGRLIALNNTSGSSKTLTSAPTIADGVDGQRLTILNVGTDNVVLTDQGGLASSNLRLAAATRTLGTRDSIELMYSVAIGDWVELAFSNVT